MYSVYNSFIGNSDSSDIFDCLLNVYLDVQQIHRLRELLEIPELTAFGPIPLLLDPDVKIKGIIVGAPEESKSYCIKAVLLQEHVTRFL